MSVDVRNLNNDQLELRLDDKRAVLSSDVSGSGSRYTSNRGLFGKGAEWHEKKRRSILQLYRSVRQPCRNFLQRALNPKYPVKGL